MNRLAQAMKTSLLSVALTLFLVTCGFFILSGVPLWDTPKMEDVESILVSSTEYPDNLKEYTDTESIELAVNLLNFLNRSSFRKRTGTQEVPVVVISYFLSDGMRIEVSANRDTVWYKGAAYELKKKEIFINLAHVLFF